MTETSIVCSFDNSIAILTLNRPEQHNALDLALITALQHALLNAEKDSRIRVIILDAAGKDFCAGADLHWMQQSSSDNIQPLITLLKTLNAVSKPVIALAKGAIFGGGLGLLACCDLVLAADDARFCFSEVKLGLIPAVIAPYIIRSIGYSAARRYFLTAALFHSQEAEKMGLVHQVVPLDELSSQGLAEATALLTKGPQALAHAKKLLNTVCPISDTLSDYTVALLSTVRASEEAQAGMRAFLEKSTPPWCLNSK